MRLHDTHAHLDYLILKEPQLSIPELLKNHDFWIQPGVNSSRDRFCLENYLTYPTIYFMIGAHPGEVDDKWDLASFLTNEQKLLEDYQEYLYSRIIGVGEIGLDYRSDTTADTKIQQKKLFITQLKLAKELNLPFVVHCRDAFDDLLEIIEDYQPFGKPFLVHCFTGNIDNYNKIVTLGGYVAFGGIITYNNTQTLNEVVKIADRYVVETDLPWLAPQPYRGKTNLPEYIEQTINHIAKAKGITSQEVLDKSKENTKKIFESIEVV